MTNLEKFKEVFGFTPQRLIGIRPCKLCDHNDIGDCMDHCSDWWNKIWNTPDKKIGWEVAMTDQDHVLITCKTCNWETEMEIEDANNFIGFHEFCPKCGQHNNRVWHRYQTIDPRHFNLPTRNKEDTDE